MHEYPLTKVNRIKLGRAFQNTERVDLSIDCAIEGQMGRVFVDDVNQPAAFLIQVGPLSYLGGDDSSVGGHKLVENLQPHTIIMPTSENWIEIVKQIHSDRLFEFPRYSFSSKRLATEHLDTLLEALTFCDAVMKVDEEIAKQVYGIPEHFFDLSDYDSVEDFVERGIGYCLMDNNEPVACAYSSLICSKGAEVSIFVLPEYRRKGVATALACALLKNCLEHNIDPHWDAANTESCHLAEKLGYTADGTYSAFYLKPESN